MMSEAVGSGRDEVAERRDRAADARDRVADERERAADVRELALDERERELLDAVRDRAVGERLVANLRAALETRDVIGQAKGILMERLGVGPDDAFDLLRRVSQHHNVKLHDVAADVATTGEFDVPA